MHHYFDEIRKRLTGSSLLKSFSVLLSGSALTQVIALIFAPVLTRLYTPQDYGANAVYISLLTIGGVLATLRFTVTIAIAHEKNDRIVLSRICFLSAAALSALCFLASWLWGETIAGCLGFQDVRILWLLAVSIFLLGCYEVLYQNLLSLDKYKSITVISFIRVLITGCLQIAISFTGIGVYGLILGNVLALLICGVLMLRHVEIGFISTHLSLACLKEKFMEYKEYPKFSLPAEISSIASYAMIPLIITYLFSVEEAGYYALANRLIGVPVGVFGNTLRQVYLREASNELLATGGYRKTFIKVTKLLLVIALPSVAVLYALGPTFFEFLFGDEWGIVGTYVRALLLYFSARLIVVPLMGSYNLLKKQHVALILNFCLLASLAFVVLSHGVIGVSSSVGFLFMLSVFYSAVYLVSYRLMLNYSRD